MVASCVKCKVAGRMVQWMHAWRMMHGVMHAWRMMHGVMGAWRMMHGEINAQFFGLHGVQ